MEKEIYDYLMEAMYPLPCCDSCRYSDVDVKRVPCNRCDGWDKWKFHPGHREDLKRMARGIMKIVKRQSFDNKKRKDNEREREGYWRDSAGAGVSGS